MAPPPASLLLGSPGPPLSPAASAPAFRSQCDRHLLSPGCAALPGPAMSSCDKVPQPAATTDIPGPGPPRPLGSHGSLRRPRPTSLAPSLPDTQPRPCGLRTSHMPVPQVHAGACLRLSRSPREATPDPRATLPHHPARSGHPQTLLYCLSRPVFTSGTTRYVCFETRRSFASWLPSQDRSSVRGISAMFAAPRTAPGSGSAGCRQLCLAGRDVTATSVRAGTVRVCARHRVRASVPCLTRGRCPTNTDWIKARGRGGLLGNGPLRRERGTGLRGEGVRVGRAPQDARPRGRRWRGWSGVRTLSAPVSVPFSSRLSGGREARGNTLFRLSDLSRSFSADLQTVVRFPDLFPAYAAISPRAALWVTSHEYRISSFRS